MSTNQWTYQFGATLLVVGLSSTIQFKPTRGQNGGYLKIASGGGSLALVQGASAIASSGYLLGTTEVIKFEGPAIFFLAAAGATMTAALAISYSAGYSLYP